MSNNQDTEKGVYYCPGCGHKYWSSPTLSGKFEAGHKCKWCIEEEESDD